MKFILSPAKEMQTKYPIERDWQLSASSQKILDKLEALNAADYQALLKLSDKQFSQQQAYREAWQQPVTYEALALYHGLAFRQITFTDADRPYLAKHLRILSAFYGVLEPFALIKPYRLDMQTPLILEGQRLKQFWRAEFNEAFAEGETIVNLASQEFTSLFTQSRYHWVDVEFIDGGRKHSTISKKGRGAMVTYLVREKVAALDAVKGFNLDGYAYQVEQSRDDLFVFAR